MVDFWCAWLWFQFWQGWTYQQDRYSWVCFTLVRGHVFRAIRSSHIALPFMAFTNFLQFFIFLSDMFALFLIVDFPIFDLSWVIKVISIQVLISCVFLAVCPIFICIGTDPFLLDLILDALLKLRRLFNFINLILSALHFKNDLIDNIIIFKPKFS